MIIPSDKRRCEKHEYVVVCRSCGNKQTNNDDGVDIQVAKVETDVCNNCCPTSAGLPLQFCYSKDNERVCSD